MIGMLKISLFLAFLIFMSGSQSCKKLTNERNINHVPENNTDAKSESSDDVFGSKHSCDFDDDCITINADCCGCGQGGEQKAVHKKEAPEIMLDMGLVCADTQCTQMMSTKESCKKKAHCDKKTKRCRLR